MLKQTRCSRFHRSRVSGGRVTTLATCCKVTRRDGVVQGFTDHVRDLEVNGVAYQAASGPQSAARPAPRSPPPRRQPQARQGRVYGAHRWHRRADHGHRPRHCRPGRAPARVLAVLCLKRGARKRQSPTSFTGLVPRRAGRHEHQPRPSCSPFFTPGHRERRPVPHGSRHDDDRTFPRRAIECWARESRGRYRKANRHGPSAATSCPDHQSVYGTKSRMIGRWTRQADARGPAAMPGSLGSVDMGRI